MKYRVHKFSLNMKQSQAQLEQFLNSLQGEIVAIIPNVTYGALMLPAVDFLLIVEKLG